MRILFDTTTLMRENLTGIGVYASNLLRELATIPDLEVDACWKLSRFGRRELIARHVALPTRAYIPLLSDLNLRGYDLYHGPDFKILASNRYRRVVTIHDLVVYENDLVDDRFAEQGREQLERMLSKRPEAIITVSHFTRTRLLEIHPDLEPRVHAIHLGVDGDRWTMSRAGSQRLVDEPYLLSVGSVEKRKNLSRTIAAFERVWEKRPELRLVVAGGGGHGEDEIARSIEMSAARDAIVRMGYVDDETLGLLYRGAELLLYPSLYEGFGIPIIEAMAMGSPVVTSDRGAMLEVSGDAAVHVDPLEPESIAEGIERVLDDSELATSLRRAGERRAAEFTWKRCARETAEVYGKIR